jgi:heme/copper-type cytochrome/quinol oxidase subunit 3
LLISADVVLFGSLFSAYALLRASAESWPSVQLSTTIALVNTVLLGGATAAVWRARQGIARANHWLALSAFLAFAFLVLKGGEYRSELIAGLAPSTSPFLAMYFTLTGLHVLHVVAGGIGSAWLIAGNSRGSLELAEGRLKALSLYWTVVAAIWVIILFLFHLT